VKDFQDSGINAKYEIQETLGDVDKAINEYTQKNEMDLIVMAAHGYSGFRRLMLGNVANRILREGNTPLLLVRNPS
jgi:nucleotide-binding universal stress UspA family protein